jgi:predicted metal-dependent hydrolase
MSDTLSIGDPPITVHLRKNSRAKRYSLRISNKDGKISLTLPRWSNLNEAMAFARDQEGWMRKHLAKQLQPIDVRFGETILLDGIAHEIAHGQGRSVVVDGGVIYIPGRDEQLVPKLRAYFKTLARERLVPASEHYAGLLGRSIGRVTLRDTRSRWGSCTSDGHLMYSWRLVMAPRAVQNYVAAHEACHLIEMNHSDAYWALVAQVSPNYKADRNWLKVHGALLHQYQL